MPAAREIVAGGLVHLAISLGWGAVLARVLPPGREPVTGVVPALGIA